LSLIFQQHLWKTKRYLVEKNGIKLVFATCGKVIIFTQAGVEKNPLCQ